MRSPGIAGQQRDEKIRKGDEATPCNDVTDFIAERCWSGLSGTPGEREFVMRTVGSNPTLSASFNGIAVW